jgi:hypothetical protein
MIVLTDSPYPNILKSVGDQSLLESLLCNKVDITYIKVGNLPKNKGIIPNNKYNLPFGPIPPDHHHNPLIIHQNPTNLLQARPKITNSLFPNQIHQAN